MEVDLPGADHDVDNAHNGMDRNSVLGEADYGLFGDTMAAIVDFDQMKNLFHPCRVSVSRAGFEDLGHRRLCFDQPRHCRVEIGLSEYEGIRTVECRNHG